MRWVILALAIVVASLVTIIVNEVLNRVLADRRVPVLITSVETLNSPVTTDDHLLVRITRQKVRSDCTLTSIREALDNKGRATPLPGRAYARGGPAGSDYVDVEYPLDDLPAGQWYLRVVLFYHCPEDVYLVNQPVVPFQVR